MTSKLTKSNIQISGKIEIWDDMYLDLSVELSGLKQSKSGVYVITNKFNGKRYIGMSNDLERRRKRHIVDLFGNKHKSISMQCDFNSHFLRQNSNDVEEVIRDIFETIFDFRVIIYCYPSECTFWEKILIDNLHPEYNTKKKKKKLAPKVFDINGERIIEENKLDFYFNTGCTSISDDDCEEEMM